MKTKVEIALEEFKKGAENSAFPIKMDLEKGLTTFSSGLTKREYFSALAMQGIMSNPNSLAIQTKAELVNIAVKTADLLIKELNKEQNGK